MKRFQLALIIGIVTVGIILLIVGNYLRTAKPNATPSPTSSAASPTFTTSPSPSASIAWPTADVSQSFQGQVPPTPTLTALRVGAHPEGGYDRIALDFQQAQAPGYTVRYVNTVVRDGSGQPVTLTGQAFLQLVFTPAAAHNDAGQSTLASPPTQPVATGFAGLQSYVLNGDFEGHVSIALGQDRKDGFHISTIKQSANSWTVVVDVKRP